MFIVVKKVCPEDGLVASQWLPRRGGALTATAVTDRKTSVKNAMAS